MGWDVPCQITKLKYSELWRNTRTTLAVQKFIYNMQVYLRIEEIVFQFCRFFDHSVLLVSKIKFTNAMHNRNNIPQYV